MITLYRYIPKGIKHVSDILSKSTRFLVYYDPDIDGAVAGELSRRFLDRFGKIFGYYINDNRQHGFKLNDEQINMLIGTTIMVVDASMTRAEVEMLVDRGVNVINIDHHNIDEDELVFYEKDGVAGVIINNNYSFEPEEYKFLSGAGVVFCVINAMFPKFFQDEEEALVGLSLLSDIRPLETPYAKHLLHKLYTTDTPFLQYLISITRSERDYGFGEIVLDRNYVDFTFSPKVNALFRLNKGEEAISVFRGTYQGSKGSLDVYRNIQNAVVDEIEKELQGVELSNLICKSVHQSIQIPYGYSVTNFIGLACSRVKNVGKTTLLYVRDNQNRVLRGSVRGLCEDVPYLQVFRSFGVVAEGHEGAFGVIELDLEKVNLEKLNQEIARLEEGYTERKYDGRLLDVNNLSFFMNSKRCNEIAHYNNYVRDQQRIYLRYTGDSYKKEQFGKKIEYKIDGVAVNCFDENLTPANGLILPIFERRHYKSLFLKGY